MFYFKFKEYKDKTQTNSGFSLLEVIVTLGILVTIIFSVSNLMRSTFDVKVSLSQKNKVTGKLNRVMQKIHSDIAQTFFISSKDHVRNLLGSQRSIFKIEKQSKGDFLGFTYMGHMAKKEHSPESELSYVVYKLEPSKENEGRMDLFRGELPRIPSSDYTFKTDPAMKLFARDIASFEVRPWNGSDWSKSGWDTSFGDTQDKLPHMVQIILSSWSEDFIPDSYDEEESFVYLSTITYIPSAIEFKELKIRNTSFNWKL